MTLLHATLTLALLLPEVEVTLNQTISSRHSFRQRKASFNEAEVQTHPARTDSSSQITLTGEQITGELLSDNMQLIPFAISPLGLFGPTINYFLYGTPPTGDYKTLHNIDKSKFPHASNMAQQAFTRTPSNILARADSIWKSKQRNHHYGGSYKSPDPSTYLQSLKGKGKGLGLHTNLFN